MIVSKGGMPPTWWSAVWYLVLGVHIPHVVCVCVPPKSMLPCIFEDICVSRIIVASVWLDKT